MSKPADRGRPARSRFRQPEQPERTIETYAPDAETVIRDALPIEKKAEMDGPMILALMAILLGLMALVVVAEHR
ncbi:MAG: hypothetical protein ABR613_10215 [Actinomycetota bacterium]